MPERAVPRRFLNRERHDRYRPRFSTTAVTTLHTANVPSSAGENGNGPTNVQ